jgi:endonuclease/exonuclease/phosphatase family metal-dependent hydrolase
MKLPPSSANELRLIMDPQSFMLVEYEEPRPPSNNAFVTASFNIRIDTDGKGKPMDTGDNAWQARRPRVAEVIRRGKFELIGFQEVTKTMWPDLVSDMSEYRFADGPDKQGPNPIAYRPEIFERLDSGRFALSEKPGDYQTLTWGSSSVRVCQWALLRHKATGRLVRVFNQHPDWKSMEQRVKGMELVIGKIKAAKEKGEMVILTGDMNDMEGAVSIHKFAPFDERYLVGDSIRLAKSVLRDSFDITETLHAGPVLSSHGYSAKPASRLDYIFVSDGFRVLTHRTHDDRPDGKYPSDHDAVSALIDFK